MSKRGMKNARFQGCKMSDTIGLVPVSNANIGVIRSKKKITKNINPKWANNIQITNFPSTVFFFFFYLIIEKFHASKGQILSQQASPCFRWQLNPPSIAIFFYIFNHGNRRLRRISWLIYKSAERPQRLGPNVSNILIGRHVELILLLPYLQVSCHDKWVFIRVHRARGPQGGTEACVWTMRIFFRKYSLKV